MYRFNTVSLTTEFDIVDNLDNFDACISDRGTAIFERNQHNENDNDRAPHDQHNNECRNVMVNKMKDIRVWNLLDIETRHKTNSA